MELREMNILDYEQILSIWKNTSGMGLNNIDDSREGIEKYLVRNPNTCYVAEKNNEIVGVILAGHDGRRGFIYHLAVKETERKKGIGKSLVEKALYSLQKEGINKVGLVVFSENKIGNVFWEREGFEKRNDLCYRNKTISIREMKKI